MAHGIKKTALYKASAAHFKTLTTQPTNANRKGYEMNIFNAIINGEQEAARDFLDNADQATAARACDAAFSKAVKELKKQAYGPRAFIDDDESEYSEAELFEVLSFIREIRFELSF